jgi:hypothetical protein
MPDSSSLPKRVASDLDGARQLLAKSRSVVGFDGFVDTILHVVDKRESTTSYKRMTKMNDFAQRIGAAAGLSANMELVSQMVKLGGNGPIMANALESYGLGMTYIGNLGYPNIHPVFVDFSQRVQVYSIAEPGYTDAIEFEDGKLMFGKHGSLKEVNWKNLTSHVPAASLVELFSNASLIAMVNWTMLTEINGIFSKLLSEVAPKLTGEKRILFFDLADPAKRTDEDIAEVLSLIQRFQKFFRVVLGLNLQESRQIGVVLGIESPDETPEKVTQHASDILEKLNIDTVVIHPTAFAAAADASGAVSVEGPLAKKPKITTGAGDHFNAGFCIGRLAGYDLEASLQVGVATSGYYVRNAESPDISKLVEFLGTL